MGQIGEIIRVCATRTIGLGELLAADISPSIFARQPVGRDGIINCNHPAFIYGHLALYPARVLALSGLEEQGSAITPPEAWQDLFKAGVECQDDVEGKIYPAMNEIVDSCLSWHRNALEIVATFPDEKFAEPNPAGGTFTETFPTLGIMTNFMFNDHAMMHFGQLSTWRRAMGLGPVMK